MKSQYKLQLGDTKIVLKEMIDNGVDVNYYKIKGKHINNP
jgi:hypothetical protein